MVGILSDRCESSSTTATTHNNNNNNHQSSSHCFVGRKGFLQFVQMVLGISILHDDQNECDKDEYDKQQQQQQHWIKIQCMEQALIQQLIQGFLQLIVPSGPYFASLLVKRSVSEYEKVLAIVESSTAKYQVLASMGRIFQYHPRSVPSKRRGRHCHPFQMCQDQNSVPLKRRGRHCHPFQMCQDQNVLRGQRIH